MKPVRNQTPASELDSSSQAIPAAPASFAWQVEQQDRAVYFRLPASPNLTCVFTTRAGGVSQGAFESLNMAYGVGDDPELVTRNLEQVKQAFKLTRLVTLKQTHSAEVLYISYDRTPAEVLEGDALFTDLPDLGLGVKVADCLPVYVFSLTRPAIGLAHAGWRGTLARVSAQLVAGIERKCGIRPQDLCYAFGPCIGPECYEVGHDVAQQFLTAFPSPEEFVLPLGVPQTALPKYLLDLKGANRQLLQELGLTEVASLNRCTHCAPGLFYSARRDGTTGRNLALIARC